MGLGWSDGLVGGIQISQWREREVDHWVGQGWSDGLVGGIQIG